MAAMQKPTHRTGTATRIAFRAALIWTISLFVVMSGCASDPLSRQRYTLPMETEPPQVSSGDAPHTLALRPLRLANYLDGEGIVLQLDDITLNHAQNHLWAEDLGRQLERGLRQRLAARLEDTRVINDGGPSDAQTLRVEVQSFQGRYDGQAVAAGQWQLRSADGRVLTQEPFNVQVALDSDGYPALVRALGRSWDQVADRLAERIVELR